MPLLRLPKDNPFQVSPDFKALEFDCPCTSCTETLIEEELVDGLTRMRVALLQPLKINSGYRCPAHQKELESKGYETAKNSMHLCGAAADVMTGKHTGDQLEAVARGCGFLAVGVGKTWIHVDLRSEKERRWSYLKR